MHCYKFANIIISWLIFAIDRVIIKLSNDGEMDMLRVQRSDIEHRMISHHTQQMKVKHHLILRDVKDAVPYIVLVDTSIVGVGFPDDPSHRNFFCVIFILLSH